MKMEGHRGKTSREKVLSHISNTSKPLFTLRSPILGILTILLVLPAMSYGCTPESDAEQKETEGTAFRLHPVLQTSKKQGNTLDVFAFNNDRLQRLDSYMRIEDFATEDITMTSRGGEKIMFFCMNSGRKRYSWADMNSMTTLAETSAILERETRDSPLMTGQCIIEAGTDCRDEVRLKPLLSEIVLNSIRCDFTGRPYEDRRLEDARVYLTNVNAECSLMPEDIILPSRIINPGMLCKDDLEQFADPGMIMQKIASEIGPEPLHAGIVLSCYPNMSPKESIGSPFTRMVIEGKVGERTYYWPIDINRDGHGSEGVERNCRYVYDLTILRKGSESPDWPVGIADVGISMKVAEWNEKEEYTVCF